MTDGILSVTSDMMYKLRELTMKSYWIWHYGEYEIYHTMKLHLRRQEHNLDYPAFWNIAVPYVNVEFIKEFECEKDGYMSAFSTGTGYVLFENKKHPLGRKIPIKAGKHTVRVIISKTDGLPALFMESDICPSDKSWLCNHRSGNSKTVGWDEYFDSLEKNPEIFPFSYEHKKPVKYQSQEDGMIYDFGTELFGYLNILNADEKEELGVFYGETEEEAKSGEKAILFEYVSGKKEYRLRRRAFRYVVIKCLHPEKLDVSMDYEYLPLEKKGDFKCDNELFNSIYDTSVYTFHLNCREAFLDGIKRDRWIWSGDAYQSAKINSYLFADRDIVKRTALGLIGKEPIEQHINTIVDYSFYWIIGLYEYYMTYGDVDFLNRIYPMASKLVDFCEKRLDANGFVVGNDDDWTFIDWAEIDMEGAVCAEQMLLIQAYRAMAEISEATGKSAEEYKEKAELLKKKVNEYFWNDDIGAFIDSFESGKNNVTRHANIFAVMYEIATKEQKEKIRENVLKNDNVSKITTPYFEGFELDVLCKLGEFEKVEEMLNSYWGGMLKEGADTLWEEYNPDLEGSEHYSMYGEPYGKSMCHAWGAGPVYLFGRYYLGVYPTSSGFKTFEVRPNLGGLNKISGVVPVGEGTVEISLDSEKLCVKADVSGGTLIWKDERYEIIPGEDITLGQIS